MAYCTIILDKPYIFLPLLLYKYKTTYQSNTYHDFQYNYVLQWTGDINDLKLKNNEVTEVKWINLTELKSILESEEKINWSLIENQQDMLDWIDNNY